MREEYALDWSLSKVFLVSILNITTVNQQNGKWSFDTTPSLRSPETPCGYLYIRAEHSTVCEIYNHNI